MSNTYLSPQGFHRPTLQERIDQLVSEFQAIYGTDIDVDDESPDGQVIRLFANEYTEIDQALEDLYNGFNPNNSSGNVLRNLVVFNGIKALESSKSTVTLIVTSTAPNYTFPANMMFKDNLGQRWLVREPFTTDATSSASVTAKSVAVGKVYTAANSITIVDTPVFGFNSVTNPAVPQLGQPEEIDANLKIRRTLSVAKPSMGMVESIKAEILNITGVQGAEVFENDDDITVSIGSNYQLKAHSVGVVVYGGDDDEIAKAIQQNKAPGCHTGIYDSSGVLIGTNVAKPVVGKYGMSFTINFARPIIAPFEINLELPAANPLSVDQVAAITNAVKEFCDQSTIGAAISAFDVMEYVNHAYGYVRVRDVTIGVNGNPLDSDIQLDPVEKLLSTNVTLTVSYT